MVFRISHKCILCNYICSLRRIGDVGKLELRRNSFIRCCKYVGRNNCTPVVWRLLFYVLQG
jgi:hypothetical protein